MSRVDIDLFRHGARVDGALDLLGTDEVAHTTALGWTLAASPTFASSLVEDITGSRWTPIQVTLEARDDLGRTDVELRGERPGEHLIVEAKLGVAVPTPAQLDKYEKRLDAGGTLAVVSHRPAIKARPRTTLGHPVVYRMWSDVMAVAAGSAAPPSRVPERRAAAELVRYLGKGVAMPGPSARVWVVPLAHGPVIDRKAGVAADLAWVDVVDEHGRYFHPAASKQFPSPPTLPHYLGFRYAGKLHRISYVDSWEVVEDLAPLFDGVPPGMFADDAPFVVYTLGPAVVPAEPVPSGRVWGPGRNWADLDLLLVGPTVAAAVHATRMREQPTA
jgi:hypothetical protein